MSKEFMVLDRDILSTNRLSQLDFRREWKTWTVEPRYELINRIDRIMMDAIISPFSDLFSQPCTQAPSRTVGTLSLKVLTKLESTVFSIFTIISLKYNWSHFIFWINFFLSQRGLNQFSPFEYCPPVKYSNILNSLCYLIEKIYKATTRIERRKWKNKAITGLYNFHLTRFALWKSDDTLWESDSSLDCKRLKLELEICLPTEGRFPVQNGGRRGHPLQHELQVVVRADGDGPADSSSTPTPLGQVGQEVEELLVLG